MLFHATLYPESVYRSPPIWLSAPPPPPIWPLLPHPQICPLLPHPCPHSAPLPCPPFWPHSPAPILAPLPHPYSGSLLPAPHSKSQLPCPPILTPTPLPLFWSPAPPPCPLPPPPSPPPPHPYLAHAAPNWNVCFDVQSHLAWVQSYLTCSPPCEKFPKSHETSLFPSIWYFYESSVIAKE